MDDDRVLDDDIAAFEADRAKLLCEAAGKFALYYQGSFVEAFDSDDAAIAYGYQAFGNVPFLVKEIVEVDRVEYLFAVN